MKGLILSRGKRTKGKSLIFTATMQLILVDNTPIWDNMLAQIPIACLKEIGVGTAPETERINKNQVNDGSIQEINVAYIRQRVLRYGSEVKTKNGKY